VFAVVSSILKPNPKAFSFLEKQYLVGKGTLLMGKEAPSDESMISTPWQSQMTQNKKLKASY